MMGCNLNWGRVRIGFPIRPGSYSLKNQNYSNVFCSVVNYIKKFLETDYPRGRAIELPACRQAGFAGFIPMVIGNRNFVFNLTQNCRKWQFRPLPRRGKSETLSTYRQARGRTLGELFRLKHKNK